MTDKKIAVIGLGSMGKRRLRNLKHLGIQHLFGIDPRVDRRSEVDSSFGIPVFQNLQSALEQQQFDAWIISVPPDLHDYYLKMALDLSVPAFVEASVISDGLPHLIAESQAKNVLLAPSYTLGFHPAVTYIAETLRAGNLGKLSNVMYHSGQYLPDWHPYEKVSEFYVSNPATGGAREIVPFELTWMTSVFGFPISVAGMHKKTIHIEGAEDIDDTYNCLLEYPEFLLSLTVDVVSRKARRTLVINGENGQLIWDWNLQNIVINSNEETSKVITFNMMEAAEGYNKNITEEMYIREMDAFLSAAFDGKSYPNSMEKDLKVLRVMEALEESFKTKTYISLS